MILPKSGILLRSILERAGYGPIVTGNSGQDALQHLGLAGLRGLIAICAKCKRVRMDGTYRKRIEDFLEQHLDAKIQRDICPTCLEQALPKAG
jgi:hypothetical protein